MLKYFLVKIMIFINKSIVALLNKLFLSVNNLLFMKYSSKKKKKKTIRIRKDSKTTLYEHKRPSRKHINKIDDNKSDEDWGHFVDMEDI